MSSSSPYVTGVEDRDGCLLPNETPNEQCIQITSPDLALKLQQRWLISTFERFTLEWIVNVKVNLSSCLPLLEKQSPMTNARPLNFLQSQTLTSTESLLLPTQLDDTLQLTEVRTVQQ